MSKYIDADSFFEEFEELDKEPYNNYPSAYVFEGVQRNEDFNRVIEELVEIEAKNDIGYFTSAERRQFNAYVEDLLSMTIERAEA